MAESNSQTDAARPASRPRNSRRNFLRTAGGVAAGTALFVAGCDGDAIPTEEELTAGGLSVSGADAQDLTVTFTVGMDGRTTFPDRVERARIALSNGDTINLIAEGINPGDSVDYTFDEAGTYSAVLITEGDFRGEARSRRVRFSVGRVTVRIDFSNDFGVLNYAYALEQLEAAYYERAVQAIEDEELTVNETTEVYLRASGQHEAIHRDFLEAAIDANGGTPIPMLVPNFDAVDFGDRDSVLNTAQQLEDVGVAAYNGAGSLLQNSTFLTLAGKIVSVEARHAATVRAIIGGGRTNFADLSDDFLQMLGADEDSAFDVASAPGQVLPIVQDFIATPLRATGL